MVANRSGMLYHSQVASERKASAPVKVTVDTEFRLHVIGPEDRVILVVPQRVTDEQMRQFAEQLGLLVGLNRAAVVREPE